LTETPSLCVWGFCGEYQAEIAAREAKSEKQDGYAAMRRKRDEEREEEDRLKVSLIVYGLL
jgi:hypothetical protein